MAGANAETLQTATISHKQGLPVHTAQHSAVSSSVHLDDSGNLDSLPALGPGLLHLYDEEVPHPNVQRSG